MIRGAGLITGASEHPEQIIPDTSRDVAAGTLADAALTFAGVDRHFSDASAPGLQPLPA